MLAGMKEKDKQYNKHHLQSCIQYPNTPRYIQKKTKLTVSKTGTTKFHHPTNDYIH